MSSWSGAPSAPPSCCSSIPSLFSISSTAGSQKYAAPDSPALPLCDARSIFPKYVSPLNGCQESASPVYGEAESKEVVETWQSSQSPAVKAALVNLVSRQILRLNSTL